VGNPNALDTGFIAALSNLQTILMWEMPWIQGFITALSNLQTLFMWQNQTQVCLSILKNVLF
jgi:hypothetical protein